MNTSKYIRTVASMLGDDKLELFAAKVVRSMKKGDVEGVKGAIKLLSDLLAIGDDVESVSAENLSPTESKDRVRIVLAFRLRKDKNGKIRVSDIQTTGVGNLEADKDVDEMRKVLCVLTTKTIRTFVKCYAEGEDATLDLYKTLVKEIGELEDDGDDTDND